MIWKLRIGKKAFAVCLSREQEREKAAAAAAAAVARYCLRNGFASFGKVFQRIF